MRKHERQQLPSSPNNDMTKSRPPILRKGISRREKQVVWPRAAKLLPTPKRMRLIARVIEFMHAVMPWLQRAISRDLWMNYLIIRRAEGERNIRWKGLRKDLRFLRVFGKESPLPFLYVQVAAGKMVLQAERIMKYNCLFALKVLATKGCFPFNSALAHTFARKITVADLNLANIQLTTPIPLLLQKIKAVKTGILYLTIM